MLLSAAAAWLSLACAPIFAGPQVVPVARGPVVKAIRAQLGPLTKALPDPGGSLAGFRAAFNATVVPAPATPAQFAARSFIAEALAAPETALPELVKSLEAAGGKKALRAAVELRRLGEVLAKSHERERRSVSALASSLRESFDGAAAAPGEAVDLSRWPTREPGNIPEKKAEKKRLKEIKKLRPLQKTLYADGDQAVLVVLDGLDTAGKGGAIDAFRGLNPSWTRVEQVKKPTPAEFAEHYLKRIRRKAPQSGESKMVFLDRSHYEDIFVPTVMALLHAQDPAKYKPAMFDAAEVASRYGQNIVFERELAAMGVKVVKIFLHVSREVQRERLQDRLDKPEKRWKIPPDEKGRVPDLETRKNLGLWVGAREAVLARTSTWWAPWIIIGADDEDARDLSVVRLVRRAMERMGLVVPEYPELAGVKVPK